ncbi:hypothetical protein NQ317_001040 [Molorchus minor]|uniref:Uncharacterized protein n=1 Tax=Molorchus minor TaxID=1323400 RepID=A0ABQ9IV24_9CUCU|nr:hypothetical protein NQ317_001040 [Molorchus minor]
MQAALEAILNLQPLEWFIKRTGSKMCSKTQGVKLVEVYQKGHSRILAVIGRRNIRIPSKEDWTNNGVIEEGETSVYTDASITLAGAGAGIYSEALDIRKAYKLTEGVVENIRQEKIDGGDKIENFNFIPPQFFTQKAHLAQHKQSCHLTCIENREPVTEKLWESIASNCVDGQFFLGANTVVASCQLSDAAAAGDLLERCFHRFHGPHAAVGRKNNDHPITKRIIVQEPRNTNAKENKSDLLIKQADWRVMEEAERLRVIHKREHPDYKYQPRRRKQHKGPDSVHQLPHGQNVTFSRSMKQEDSPCSPGSHSSTSPSTCSSQPHSPQISSQLLKSCDQHNLDLDPYHRIPEIDSTYMPDDCLDSSDLDQYLPTEAQYQQMYLKHALDDEESNNNYKSKRLCSDSMLQSTEVYEESSSSYGRYHELQPSSVVKSERYLHSNASGLYSYQSGMPLSSSPSYYSNNNHQYLPSYQYLHQRPIYSTSATIGNYTSVEGNNEAWGHYSM